MKLKLISGTQKLAYFEKKFFHECFKKIIFWILKIAKKILWGKKIFQGFPTKSNGCPLSKSTML